MFFCLYAVIDIYSQKLVAWEVHAGESGDAAREGTHRFVAWYNTEHLHSALAFVTPDARHRGEERRILEQRRCVYAAAREKHPLRWKRHTRVWTAPERVWLNPPPQGRRTGEEGSMSSPGSRARPWPRRSFTLDAGGLSYAAGTGEAKACPGCHTASAGFGAAPQKAENNDKEFLKSSTAFNDIHLDNARGRRRG